MESALHLDEVECSEAFYDDALARGLQILSEPAPLEFDASGNLKEKFELDSDSLR